MIMHYSRISLVKKKKAPVGVAVLNRPPRLKGVIAKPKYVAPEDWSVITYETSTVGTEDEVKNDPYYLGVCFRGKKLPGKKTDYEIVKVEHLKESGVTSDHYNEHQKPVEVLRPWPYPWPETTGVKNYVNRLNLPQHRKEAIARIGLENVLAVEAMRGVKSENKEEKSDNKSIYDKEPEVKPVFKFPPVKFSR